MQEVLHCIQENSALGPASLFFQLLLVYKDNREAIKHLTQKQVYYYWSKSFEGKFKRCEDEFESAKIRITEFRNVKLLYASNKDNRRSANEVGRRRALAFLCLIAKISAHKCQEAIVDSARK
jgi:hypothetical protein